jgi:predicted nucleotidyltransferase component of viral defense system
MLKEVIARARQGENTQERLNWLREEMHHLILQEADRKGAFGHICFVGGTALRLIYGLNRFSEDLDFSTSSALSKPFQLERLLRSIQNSLDAFGFACELRRFHFAQTVQSGFLVFSNLVHQVDHSLRKQQNLAIKFEVDTKPPAGAVETLTPVTGIRLYKVRHYALGSLFAGKLHAILFRQYAKGRDYYDFLWYTGLTEVRVNGKMLENAILQTQKRKSVITPKTLLKLLSDKFEGINFQQLKKDVAPFISDQKSLDLFDKKIFIAAIPKIKIGMD